MKKLTLIAFLMVFLNACDSEKAPDCLQTSGGLRTKQYTVPTFKKIQVNEGIQLILKQGDEQKIEVTAGKNLLHDVSVKVENASLVLSYLNTCNLVRAYTPVKVMVTAPEIVEIVSSTQYDIVSDGVLSYPELTLISEDFSREENQTTGNFILALDCLKFALVFNNLSNCFITGKAISANIFFAAGNSRFEGENFEVDHITIFHRSTNDMIVNPLESLQGDIYSTGNIVSLNKPPTVDVEEHYKGKLIFRSE